MPDGDPSALPAPVAWQSERENGDGFHWDTERDAREDCDEHGGIYWGLHPASVVEQLARERDNAQRSYLYSREEIDTLRADVARLTRERDEARNMAECDAEHIDTLRAERDEARAEVAEGVGTGAEQLRSLQALLFGTDQASFGDCESAIESLISARESFRTQKPFRWEVDRIDGECHVFRSLEVARRWKPGEIIPLYRGPRLDPAVKALGFAKLATWTHGKQLGRMHDSRKDAELLTEEIANGTGVKHQIIAVVDADSLP